ncbi:hypothetical protein HY629_03040 [Candidatus Uhrbacteria bacterium]|nr:hypothetical protein [Candidatus Uhrbacteria bacterium]
MQKVLLIILDGWGIAPLNEENVFTTVKTPTFDHLVSMYPITALHASGAEVGLADGEVGNSEAGHWNLGTGQRFRPEIWQKVMIQSTTSIGEVIGRAGKRQLHLSETEKYVHVTYFFNGGHSSPFPGEDDQLVPSPKVSSYDEKPAMSLSLITRRLTAALTAQSYEFIVVNVPNLDIVAHTGNGAAVGEALRVADRSLRVMTATALTGGYTTLIVADHGNIEHIVRRETATPDRRHTLAPVPCILIRKDLEGKGFRGMPAVTRDLSVLPTSGALRDVPVTILELLGLEKPMGMQGRSLLSLIPTAL